MVSDFCETEWDRRLLLEVVEASEDPEGISQKDMSEANIEGLPNTTHLDVSIQIRKDAMAKMRPWGIEGVRILYTTMTTLCDLGDIICCLRCHSSRDELPLSH